MYSRAIKLFFLLGCVLAGGQRSHAEWTKNEALSSTQSHRYVAQTKVLSIGALWTDFVTDTPSLKVKTADDPATVGCPSTTTRGGVAGGGWLSMAVLADNMNATLALLMYAHQRQLTVVFV